jgi:hypothetical protein
MPPNKISLLPDKEAVSGSKRLQLKKDTAIATTLLNPTGPFDSDPPHEVTVPSDLNARPK